MEATEDNKIHLKNWILRTIHGWLIGFACVLVLAVFRAIASNVSVKKRRNRRAG